MSKVNIEEGRRLLRRCERTPISGYIGAPGPENRLASWAVNNVAALMDEVERLQQPNP